MNNQPPRPFVAPSEYDRNKDVITSYRKYLDIYEQMNEQGLRNHEEIERMERMLEEQVRQGDEAKRRLMLLRQSAGRRITDGQVTVPNVNVAAPATVPHVQPASSSAYIEEIHEPRVATNDHAPNANYVPYSVPRHPQTSQPSYYDPQRQQFPVVSSHQGLYRDPPVERHIPSPPQLAQPSTPNVAQHVQGYYTNAAVPQQAAPRNHYRAQMQPQNARPTQPTLTPAQQEHFQRLQQQKRMDRHLAMLQQTAAGPHYYPPAQESNVPNHIPTPNQSTALVNEYPRQNVQRASVPNRIPTPNRSTALVNEYPRQSIQQAGVPNRIQTPNQSTAPVSEHSRQNVPSASVPPQRVPENLNQVQRPPSAPASNVIAISVPVANTATRTVSSLDDALGSVNAHVREPTTLPVSISVQPPAPTSASPRLVDSIKNLVKENSSKTLSSSLAIDLEEAAQAKSHSSVVHTPARPSATALDMPASPLRTPKDVDKKHLARDILRALKRPRSENSSMSEPEPKRHASDSATADIASNVASVVIQPAPSAPNPTSPPFTTSTAPAQPTTFQSTGPSAAPALPPNPPSQSTAATQSSAPPAKQPAPTPVASSSTTTQAPSELNKAPQVHLQKYSEDTLKHFDNRRPLYPGQLPHAALSDGSNTLPKASWPPSHPTSSLSSSGLYYYQPLAGRNLTTVSPVDRGPQRPLKFMPVQGLGQPQGPSSGPSSSNKVGCQVPSSAGPVTSSPFADQPASLPAPNASVSTPTAVSQGTSSSKAVVTEGQRKITVTQVPTVLQMDKVAEPRTPISPTVIPPARQTPLFLPSPTSSPSRGTSSAEAEEVSAIVLPGKKDKGKAKAVSPSSPPPSSLSHGSPANKAGVTPGSRFVFAYVSVPPLPSYAQRRRKEGAGTRDDELDAIQQDFGSLGVVSRSRSPSLGDYTGPSGSRTPSVLNVPPQMEDNESDTAEELDSLNLHFTSYDDAEKEVLYENCSILREIFCRWSECDGVLNSPGAVLRHFDVKHGPRRVYAESPWTCEWTGCGYTCISKKDYRQHIERHAIHPLWCPFARCEEVLRTPRQLVRHKRSEHSNDVVRRRTVEPSPITGSASIPSIPSSIPKIAPAYMIQYSCIQGASISRQRHEIIMPGILQRISGNVPTQLHSYNAARPMPTTPSGNHTLDAPAAQKSPYSFLRNRSTRYSSYLSRPARSRNFADLSSSHTTNLVQRGLVLWPEKDGEAIPEDMIERLEEEEEDTVEQELIGGEDAEGHDVFGPTIKIEASGSGGGNGDVGDDGRGTGGRSKSPTDRRISSGLSASQ